MSRVHRAQTATVVAIAAGAVLAPLLLVPAPPPHLAVAPSTGVPGYVRIPPGTPAPSLRPSEPLVVGPVAWLAPTRPAAPPTLPTDRPSATQPPPPASTRPPVAPAARPTVVLVPGPPPTTAPETVVVVPALAPAPTTTPAPVTSPPEPTATVPAPSPTVTPTPAPEPTATATCVRGRSGRDCRKGLDSDPTPTETSTP